MKISKRMRNNALLLGTPFGGSPFGLEIRMKILKENQKLREMKKQRKKSQVVLAVILVIFGVIMITVAFIVPPLGVIDPTVLTAFGEILTFAGSLIGIDYHYRYKSPPNPL